MCFKMVNTTHFIHIQLIAIQARTEIPYIDKLISTCSSERPIWHTDEKVLADRMPILTLTLTPPQSTVFNVNLKTVNCSLQQ